MSSIRIKIVDTESKEEEASRNCAAPAPEQEYDEDIVFNGPVGVALEKLELARNERAEKDRQKALELYAQDLDQLVEVVIGLGDLLEQLDNRVRFAAQMDERDLGVEDYKFHRKNMRKFIAKVKADLHAKINELPTEGPVFVDFGGSYIRGDFVPNELIKSRGVYP